MSAGQGSHPSAGDGEGSYVSVAVRLTEDAVFAFEEPSDRPPRLRLLMADVPGMVLIAPADLAAAEALHAATGRLLDIVRAQDHATAAAGGGAQPSPPGSSSLRVVKP